MADGRTKDSKNRNEAEEALGEVREGRSEEFCLEGKKGPQANCRDFLIIRPAAGGRTASGSLTTYA